ncbi:MAG: hypothetical protein J6B16_03575 [Clostridia bacterium]|nr:hypothetical protein [Clostridia bacterium]
MCKIFNKAKIWLIALAVILVAGIVFVSVPALGLNKDASISNGYEVKIVTEVDISGNLEKIKDTAKDVFKEAGVNYSDYYEIVYPSPDFNSESVFVFKKEVSSDVIAKLDTAIEAAINGDGVVNKVGFDIETGYASTVSNVAPYGWAIGATAIALAVIGIYLMFRQRFANAFTVLATAIIEVLLFIALTSLTRVVVTTAYGAIVALSLVLTLALSIIYTGKMWDATGKNSVDAKLSNDELVNKFECSNVKATAVVIALVAVVAIAFIVAGIFKSSALIWTGVAICLSAISVAFTVLCIMPSVWMAFKKIGKKK